MLRKERELRCLGVADDSIVTDAWVIEAAPHTINFEIPSNLDDGSRCILGFMPGFHG
jgi:hypothetical protein